MIRHLLGATLAIALILFIALPPASSRTWRTTPDQLARDYLTINDTRPGGEMVLLMWLASPMLQPGINGRENLAAILDRYVLIMAVHGHFDRVSGTASFDDITALQATDKNGAPLNALTQDKIPPTAAGIVTVMEGVFRQVVGPMGKGMKTFIFDSGSVGVCKSGVLSVPYAGETYTWKTPIPGCQQI